MLFRSTGEKAVPGHCWGYAPRKIRGSTTRWSNHAWGLAVDFNAPAHPMGVAGTWGVHGPAVSQIANDLGFRWGGDYSGRKDDMHFEYMGTPADAAAYEGEDDVAYVSEEDAKFLADLRRAVEGEGSDATAVKYMIRHLRQSRETSVTDGHTHIATVRLT